jgi:prepilin-type processing-associated H-X9-DG protein
MGLLQYTQDWDEYTVPVQNYEVINSTLQEVPWQFRIQPYVQSAQVFKCPSFPRRGVFNVYATGGGNQPAAIPRSYYLNGGNEGATGTSDFGGKRPFRKHDKGVVPFAQVLYPATTIAMGELQGGQSDPKISDLTYVTDGTTFNAFLNHSGLTNFAFMDGHVKTMKPSQTATTEINMWTNSNATDTTPTATKGATANLQSKLATAESLLQ